MVIFGDRRLRVGDERRNRANITYREQPLLLPLDPPPLLPLPLHPRLHHQSLLRQNLHTCCFILALCSDEVGPEWRVC